MARASGGRKSRSRSHARSQRDHRHDVGAEATQQELPKRRPQPRRSEAQAEDLMFFPKLRKRAKWIFVLLAAAFGIGYRQLCRGRLRDGRHLLQQPRVQALDAGSATELWSTEALARRQLTAPVAFSNFVAVGDFEGYLHLLAQTDGRMAGRVRVDGDGLRAAPLTVGDLLFVYGNSGDLAAYKLK